MSSISRFINYVLHKKLNKVHQETDLPFCLSWNFKVTLFYVLSFALSLAVIRYYSLSFFITPRHSFYHSLSLVLLLVVSHCTTRSHFLSLVFIRCHSLNSLLSLAVTRYTTRLSFYKRSQQAIMVLSKFQNKFLKSRSARFKKIKEYTKKRN